MAFKVMEDSEKSEDLLDWDGSSSSAEEEKPAVSEELDEQQWAELEELLCESKHVLRSEPGRTTWTKHCIDAEGARPIKQTPYHIPYTYREMVEKELAEMEEKGIIKPSTSDWV